MHEIHGTVMHYPWGSPDAIPALLGVEPDGRPYAEYWLGAHPTAPARLDGERLDDLLARQPDLLGPGAEGGLPFMVKLLSARTPLSLQAHPRVEDAAAGFAREEASGLTIDDPRRIFKDPHGKHELLIALTDFSLLLGFRAPSATMKLLVGLGVDAAVLDLAAPLVTRRGTAGLQEVFLDVLSLDGDRLDLVNLLLVAAVRHRDDADDVGELARLILQLDEAFPANPGIVAACLLNHVTLRPGEAVYVPPGVMHSDLFGTGVEVLSNSDNVVRGGLTSKHIAVNELVDVVDFAEQEPTILRGEPDGAGSWRYPHECPSFDVWRLEPGPSAVTIPAAGLPRIGLVTAGRVTLTQPGVRLDLEQGQAIFVGAHEPAIACSGSGELFVACSGA